MKIRRLVVSLSAVCFSILFAATSWAAPAGGSAKIGYFDAQAISSQCKWVKQANEEFKKQSEVITADVNQKANAFKAAKEEYDKKSDVWDQKTKDKKQKELLGMAQEGEKMAQETNQKLGKLRSELFDPISNKMVEIVRKVARDQGYDYVFEREKAGLAVAPDKDDLTKKVLDELDKAAPLK